MWLTVEGYVDDVAHWRSMDGAPAAAYLLTACFDLLVHLACAWWVAAIVMVVIVM